MSRALYIPEPLLRRMVLAELDGSVDVWVKDLYWPGYRMSHGLRAAAETVLSHALVEADSCSTLGVYYPRLPFPGGRLGRPSAPLLYDQCRETRRRNRNLGVFHRVWRTVQVIEAYVQLHRQRTGAT